MTNATDTAAGSRPRYLLRTIGNGGELKGLWFACRARGTVNELRTNSNYCG